MNSPRSAVQNATPTRQTSPMRVDPNPKPAFGVRVADVAALRADGSTVIGQRKIPTLPEFDQAFAAFAQGTLFQTENGYMAIEDMQPGDWVTTASGNSEQVNWIGSTTFSANDQGPSVGLTRVMADSFGVNRPENFISLGPAARVLKTPHSLRNQGDASRMMTPAQQFLDGVNVIRVMPPTPVRMFHIGLRKHSALIASGLEVESFHPGLSVLRNLSHTLRSVYLSLFPHISHLADLGPLHYTRAPADHDSALH